MKKPILSPFVQSLALAILIAPLVWMASLATRRGPLTAGPAAGAPGDEQTVSIFLPIILSRFPRSESVFGVETLQLRLSPKIAKLPVSWVRNATIDWAKIEPILTSPRSYDWTQVDEAGLQEAARQGFNLIAVIKSTPLWAQKVTGSYCSPPKPEYLDEFTQFIQAVVTRYSAPPYHIRHWEIGNEVDVDPDIVAADSPFGCWGKSNDKFYGGGYYADMLKQVYPAIKAVDPPSQVLIGGLLLNCDPTAPGQADACRPARFLEGILVNQGAAYFDLLSYHTYAYYNGQIFEDTASWSARGGAFTGKISFLREVMAAYGVNKPLLLSEVALICPEAQAGCAPAGNDFLEKQANYVSWVYIRARAENLKGAIWYTFEDSGWRSSGLHTGSVPNPAYSAYAFTAQKLSVATWVGTLNLSGSIRAYEFQLPGKRLWVMWSSTQTPQTIALPADASAIYDKYGNSISLTSSITVNSPIYVEISP